MHLFNSPAPTAAAIGSHRKVFLLTLLVALGGIPGARAQSVLPIPLSREARIARALASFAVDAGPGATGRCLVLGEGAVLLNPDLSEKDLLAYISGLPEYPTPSYFIVGRWTATATDGAVALLQPITLTYSFIPDGTHIPTAPFAQDPAGPSELSAVVEANFPGGMEAWESAFASAFQRWGELTGITYVKVDDDGAAFPGSPGVLGSPGRGDLRIGMHFIGNLGVAYNRFPDIGDMVLGSEDIGTFAFSLENFRLLRNIVMHEHGHGFGLDHVVPPDFTKLMEASVHTQFDGPQEAVWYSVLGRAKLHGYVWVQRRQSVGLLGRCWWHRPRHPCSLGQRHLRLYGHYGRRLVCEVERSYGEVSFQGTSQLSRDWWF
ncbi:hypothetical protein IIC65_02570, partial [Candidatus Sumerlaeota bacterium]|nr:hypothetical protein [Candidatus Sumerlaeota bacterium]